MAGLLERCPLIAGGSARITGVQPLKSRNQKKLATLHGVDFRKWLSASTNPQFKWTPEADSVANNSNRAAEASVDKKSNGVLEQPTNPNNVCNNRGTGEKSALSAKPLIAFGGGCSTLRRVHKDACFYCAVELGRPRRRRTCSCKAKLGLQPPRSTARTLFILPHTVQVAFQFGEVAKPLPHASSFKLD